MKRSTDRILTTHVGSLVRPDDLVAFLRAKHDGKPYDIAAHDRCLAAAVAEVVRRQAQARIDIVSDGEFGKSVSWARYVLGRLDGFELRPYPGGQAPANRLTAFKDMRDFPEFYAEYQKTEGFTDHRTGTWASVGPLRYKDLAPIQRDIDNFKAALKGANVAEAFMPAVAPGSVAPERKDEYYSGDRDYLFGLADALNVEYRAIVDAGFVLQIDDAHLPLMYERIVPAKPVGAYLDWAALRIEALNRALAGIPESAARYHICWGSWNGPHVNDVPFKTIADIVLRARVGAFSIEMANPRHEHEWRVWETLELPPGKMLIPGVISHATNVVEHPELVAERIVRLARLVGRENIIAGTDCGFAQGPFVRRVHPSIMWAKLEALAAGARLASAELWGRRTAA